MLVKVVQWSESLGEQGVLCTTITRRYIDHFRIVLRIDISFIILLYIPVSFYFVLLFIKLLDL